MRILVDMDGVLANSLDPWLAAYNLKTGENLSRDDITAYNFGTCVGDVTAFFDVLATEDVFLRAMPERGASGLAQLMTLGDVYVVTYVHHAATCGEEHKKDWMRRFFPHLSWDRIVFVKDKFIVQGDVLIEDNPANIHLWLQANPQGRAFLVDQPYNQVYNQERCQRVASVAEAAQRLTVEL